LVFDAKGGEEEKGVDGLRGSLLLGDEDPLYPLAFACMNYELFAVWACNTYVCA
jgi:hypothetical protein